MDFIREWKSKTLDPEQVFGGVLDASHRRFYSHVRGGLARFPSCIAGKLYYQREATRDHLIRQ